MPEYWVLAEEGADGTPVLRRLATTDREDLARDVFNAIREAGSYGKLYLVEVIARGVV